MGNNESLPPPPPPGQPPVTPTRPAGPPAYQPPPPPPYNPPVEQFPPTTQFPVTGQVPSTPTFPGGPPGGFPPNGATAFEQPAEPPKKKTGLIIAGGLAAVAAVVGGVILFSGGDDDKTVTPGSTALPETTVFNTLPETTLPPEDTLVITLPVITEPPVTEPSVTEPEVTEPEVTAPATTIVSGADPITDDLNIFTVVLPAGLQVDTTPIVTDDDFTLASVTGAADLEGFYSEDVTFGMSVIVVGPEVESDPSEVLLFLEPDEGICTGRQEIPDHPTALGLTTMVKLDGCSPDGSAAKVLIVMALPERSSVLAIYVQGPGTADGLLPQAQAVFESVRPV